jgi:hypothetical protein
MLRIALTGLLVILAIGIVYGYLLVKALRKRRIVK